MARKKKKKINLEKIFPWFVASFLGAILVFNLILSFFAGDCEITKRKLYFKDNPLLRVKLVSCLIDRGNYSLAGNELARLEKEDDPLVKEQTKAQKLRLKSNDPKLREEEILFWKEKVVENESYPDAWVSLSLLWFSKGEKKMAQLAMRKACRLDRIREDIKRTAEEIGFSCDI